MAAGTTELESLLVRLLGDATGYQKMLADAEKSTQHTSMVVEKEAKKIQEAMNAGAQLTRSVETAQERHNRTVRDLSVLLRQGAISQETFNRAVRQSTEEANRATSSLSGMSSTLKELLAVAGGVSLGAMFTKGISLAAEAEKNRISFGVMLQDMEKGVLLVKDLQKFAAATPLQTPDIQMAAKTLLQFGTNLEDLLPLLRMLGDVTGGDAERFRQMALAFGQAQASGRLMGQDLLQMINAGFNPLKEISRTTGKSMGELKDKMEKGEISVTMLTNAFKSATSAGGQFAGLMEKQSKSLSGLFSTMQDDVDSALRVLGERTADALHLRDAMQLVSSAAQYVENVFKSFPSWLTGLVGGLAVFTAAITAVRLAWISLAFVAKSAVAPAFAGLVSGLQAAGSAIAAVSLQVAVAAGWAAIFAAVAYSVYTLTQALSGARAEQERFNEAVRQTEKLQAQVSKRQQDITTGLMEQVGGKFGPAAKKEFLDVEVKKAEAEVRGATNSVKALEAQVESLEPSWLSLWQSGKAERDVTKKQLEDQRALLETYRDRVAKLKAELAKVVSPELNPKVLAEVTKLTEKLQDQVATFGLASHWAEIYKMETESLGRVNLDAARIAAEELDALNDQKKAREEAAKATEKLTEAVADLAAEMEFENEILKMEIAGTQVSAEMKKILKMQTEGLDEARAGHLLGIAEENAALKKQEKTMKEGQKVTNEILSKDPIQKWAMEVENLEHLLAKGAITPEIFAEGVRIADEELEKAQKKAEKATKEFQKFDAALAGSAEAASRVQAFLDRNRMDFTGKPAKTPVAAEAGGAASRQAVEKLLPGRMDVRVENKEVVDVLKNIRDILEATREGEQVVLRPANLF